MKVDGPKMPSMVRPVSAFDSRKITPAGLIKIGFVS
jgi:hypothetical protein